MDWYRPTRDENHLRFPYEHPRSRITNAGNQSLHGHGDDHAGDGVHGWIDLQMKLHADVGSNHVSATGSKPRAASRTI